jgi:hypothetical protein
MNTSGTNPLLRPFRARRLMGRVSQGLKPLAEFCCPFGAPLTVRRGRPRHIVETWRRGNGRRLRNPWLRGTAALRTLMKP